MQQEYEKIFGKDVIEAKKIDSISLTEVLRNSYRELKTRNHEEIVDWGYEFLNSKMTCMLPADLTVIGGESGTGKSTFVMHLATHIAKSEKVAVFALEDRLNNFGHKLIWFEIGRLRKLRNRAQYPWNDYIVNNIVDSEYTDYYKEAANNLKNENILFQNVKKVMSGDVLLEKLQLLHNEGIKYVILDHLHYIDLNSKDSTKADYIEDLIKNVKLFLKETGMVAIIVVHYRKLNGKKPTDDDFKDSNAIRHNADYTLHLWRDRSEGISDEDRYKTLFLLPKSRNPNGEGTIEVMFDPSTNNYEDISGWNNGAGINTNKDKLIDL